MVSHFPAKLKQTIGANTVYVKEITVDETFPAYVTADNAKAANDSYQSLIDDKIEDMRKDIKGSLRSISC